MFYTFFLNLWIMRRITEAQIELQVVRGRLTRQEADMILATPQID